MENSFESYKYSNILIPLVCFSISTLILFGLRCYYSSFETVTYHWSRGQNAKLRKMLGMIYICNEDSKTEFINQLDKAEGQMELN